MKKFSKWFNENLGEYKTDIATHGCDAGFPHITYNSDGAEIYDNFSDEIWIELKEQASEFGFENTMAFIASFNRSDMIEAFLNDGELSNSGKTLLVWFACETLAHR
jgi:hypothetical protein